MAEGAVRIQPWREGKFVELKTLQEAARNQGSVLLMQDTESEKLVAVKKMPNTWVMENDAAFRAARPYENENPWKDFEITRTLSQRSSADPEQEPPIGLKFYGVFRDEAWTYFVMDYAAGGDLFGLMQLWEQQNLELGAGREEEAWPILLGLLRRLAQLHSIGIAHCDISLENVVLKDEWSAERVLEEPAEEGGLPRWRHKEHTPGTEGKVRVIDFGMATEEKLEAKNVSKRSYQAPEIRLAGEDGACYDPMLVDSFSVGVTIYSLITGNYPWLSTEPEACKFWAYVKDKGMRAMLKRRKYQGAPLIEALSEPMICLIESLTAPDPKDRKTVTEALFDLSGVANTLNRTTV